MTPVQAEPSNARTAAPLSIFMMGLPEKSGRSSRVRREPFRSGYGIDDNAVLRTDQSVEMKSDIAVSFFQSPRAPFDVIRALNCRFGPFLRVTAKSKRCSLPSHSVGRSRHRRAANEVAQAMRSSGHLVRL